MSYYPLILADSGFLFAYYSARDQHHQQVRRFFEMPAVVTELAEVRATPTLLWTVILIFIGVIGKSLLSGCFRDAILH